MKCLVEKYIIEVNGKAPSKGAKPHMQTQARIKRPVQTFSVETLWKSEDWHKNKAVKQRQSSLKNGRRRMRFCQFKNAEVPVQPLMNS